ncbi:RhuM family protein [Desulfosporosinus nitroreducens]|uniref:RhuM family protein n=1 Tax=Desulfosporosinus nitroreducens TaxID=2018668 RepID=UPI003458E4EE
MVQKEGNREVRRDVLVYNLDAIISVGYRVNSLRATQFRQWATGVLRTFAIMAEVRNTRNIKGTTLIS